MNEPININEVSFEKAVINSPVPTLLFFHGGQLRNQITGVAPKQAIIRWNQTWNYVICVTSLRLPRR